jgi:hypothetical protein
MCKQQAALAAADDPLGDGQAAEQVDMDICPSTEKQILFLHQMRQPPANAWAAPI